MATVKFSEMKSGNSYKSDLFIKRMDERTAKSGKTYLSLLASDKNEDMSLQMFDMTMSAITNSGIVAESLATITIDVTENNGTKYYNVKSIVPCEDKTINITDFVKAAPFNTEALFNKLIKMVTSCKPEGSEGNSLADLTINILNQNKEKLLYWAAGKKIHGAYLGGLILHMVLVTADILSWWEHHKYSGNYDKELLVCGAALHDIGKLEELETSKTGVAEYTFKGNMFGHLVLGIEMIDEEVARYNASMPKLSYPLMKVELLKHIIASHHGTPEKGALTYPKLPEARVINKLDEANAEDDQMDQALQTTEYGEFSPSVYGLDNTKIYKCRPASA